MRATLASFTCEGQQHEQLWSLLLGHRGTCLPLSGMLFLSGVGELTRRFSVRTSSTYLVVGVVCSVLLISCMFMVLCVFVVVQVFAHFFLVNRAVQVLIPSSFQLVLAMGSRARPSWPTQARPEIPGSGPGPAI